MPCENEDAGIQFLSAGLLKHEDVHYLSPLLQWQFARANECLWREGDLDDRLGIIVRGRIKLLKETEFPTHPFLLGMYGPGTLVGDLTFGNKLRETSAYVVEDLMIGFLSRQHFERILLERPDLGHRIFQKALISMSEQVKNAYRRLAVFF